MERQSERLTPHHRSREEGTPVFHGLGSSEGKFDDTAASAPRRSEHSRGLLARGNTPKVAMTEITLFSAPSTPVISERSWLSRLPLLFVT